MILLKENRKKEHTLIYENGKQGNKPNESSTSNKIVPVKHMTTYDHLLMGNVSIRLMCLLTTVVL